MGERTVKMVIPIGLPDDQNTIISKDCVITIPEKENPLLSFSYPSEPVGRWKAQKKDDSIEVDIILDQELPMKLEEVFNNLSPWEALQFPYGFKPIKARVDDDGITHFDEIELFEVSVAIKPPQAVISPTFHESKLTSRRILVCNICNCLLSFEDFDGERCRSLRCRSCRNCLKKIVEILNDHKARLRDTTIEEAAQRILKAITPIGLLHHEEEE